MKSDGHFAPDCPIPWGHVGAPPAPASAPALDPILAPASSSAAASVSGAGAPEPTLVMDSSDTCDN